MTKLRYIQIRPKNSIAYNSFQNIVHFEFSLGSYDNIIPEDCFMNVEYEYDLHTDANLNERWGNYATIPAGLSNNPISCFWDKCFYQVENSSVNNTRDPAQSLTALRLIAQGRMEHTTTDSSNPIVPAVSAADFIEVMDDATRKNVKTYGLDNKRAIAQRTVMSGFGRYSSGQISGKIPLGFFHTNTQNYGANARHIMQFTVHNDWRKRLIQSMEAFATESTNAPAAGPSIRINVKDVNLYIRVYESLQIPRGISQLSYYESESYYHPVVNSTTDQFSLGLKPGTEYVLVVFTRSTTNTNTVYSPTDFTDDPESNGGNSIVNSLRSLYMSVNGLQLPQPQYNNLNFLNSSKTTDDNERAYMDYLQLCTQFNSASGVPLSKAEFTRTPIFGFKIEKIPGDLSSNLTIDLTMDGTRNVGNEAGMYVIALKSMQLDISYDSDGHVESTSVKYLMD